MTFRLLACYAPNTLFRVVDAAEVLPANTVEAAPRLFERSRCRSAARELLTAGRVLTDGTLDTVSTVDEPELKHIITSR